MGAGNPRRRRNNPRFRFPRSLLGRTVDVKLVVSFSPPTVAVGHDAQEAADHVPASLGVEDKVVLTLGSGIGLTVLCVKIADVLAGLLIEAVVDVEITAPDHLGAFIGQREPSPFGKRHRPVAVERLDTADGDGSALVLYILAESQTKKIAQGTGY